MVSSRSAALASATRPAGPGGRRWPATPVSNRHRVVDTRAGRLALRGTTLLVLLAGWQLAGTEDGFGFPSLTRTLAALAELLRDGLFYRSLWATNQALLLGFALAIVVALPLAVLMARYRLAERTIRPYLSILIAVPIIAFIPVVQAVFGLTLTGRTVVVFLFSVAYVAVNCAVGLRSTDPALVEMARSFTTRPVPMLWQVTLPSAVPGLMAGVRIGLGQALIGMVVAELALVGAGVGSMITEFQGRFRVDAVMAITLVVVFEGVTLLSLAAALERRLSRWRGDAG